MGQRSGWLRLPTDALINLDALTMVQIDHDGYAHPFFGKYELTTLANEDREALTDHLESIATVARRRSRR